MIKRPYTVVLLGKGKLACKIAEYFLDAPEYTLVYVVPNVPESPWAPSLKEWAIKNNVPYVESGHYKDLPVESFDLGLSVTYDRIIKQDFIDRCKRIVNIHNGPLPHYRGVNPINWALKNNEKEHGITMHEITPGIDDGPVYSSITFPIDPKYDEVIDVYERSLEYGWLLFKQTMPSLFETIPSPQDESQARYYSKQDFEKLEERRFFTRKESLS